MAEKDERGLEADRPSEIPARGWREIAGRAWKEAGEDNVSLVSAGVAFYGFLALVPLLGAFVMTYGLVADPATVMQHVQGLFRLLPKDAATLIGDQLLSITTEAGTKKGLGLGVAILLSLYGAMKGAAAIMTALNIVYEEEEQRGFIAKNATAFAITLGAVVAALAAVAAIAAMGLAERFMPGAPGWMLALVHAGFWIGAALVVSFGIAAVYRYGPSRDEAKWRWLSAGALVATISWVAMTLLFGIYTANFGNYNATYGALGAVVVLLMWLYFSAYVLLLGAELNAEIERQTAKDTTKGPDRPLGDRNAKMADELPPPGGTKRGKSR